MWSKSPSTLGDLALTLTYHPATESDNSPHNMLYVTFKSNKFKWTEEYILSLSHGVMDGMRYIYKHVWNWRNYHMQNYTRTAFLFPPFIWLTSRHGTKGRTSSHVGYVENHNVDIKIDLGFEYLVCIE